MPLLVDRLYANPYVVLPLASLMWAGNSIVSKLAIGHITPMTLTSFRWLFACLLMALFVRDTIRLAWTVLRPRWRWVMVMGLLGYTTFNALLYLAAYHTSAVNMTILQGSLPVFVILGGLVAFGIRIGWLQTAGTAVTLIGITVIATGGDMARLAGLSFNLGDVYVLIACIAYAAYTHGLRKRPDLPGLALFAGFAFSALIASLPLYAAEVVTSGLHWPTPAGWLMLAYVTLFPSLLSQLFYIRGVELIGPARAGLFINLIPVFGALLSVVVLREPFGWHHALALILVLGGIVVAEIGKRGPAARSRSRA